MPPGVVVVALVLKAGASGTACPCAGPTGIGASASGTAAENGMAAVLPASSPAAAAEEAPVVDVPVGVEKDGIVGGGVSNVVPTTARGVTTVAD